MKKLFLYVMITLLTFSGELQAAASDDSREVSQYESISIHNCEQLRGKNAFAVFGLTPEATDTDIRKRYHKLALELHPDRNPENKSAADVAFKILGTAYSKIESAGPGRTEERLRFFNKNVTTDEPVKQRREEAQRQEFIYPKEEALFHFLTALFSADFAAGKVEALIQDGVDVNVTYGTHKSTPLMLASKIGNAENVKLLLAAGAKVDAKTDMGETALFLAAQRGHGAILELLFAAGAADVNTCTNDFSRNTPLATAVSGNHLEAAQVLLAHGANVDAKDGMGETAVFLAAQRGHLKMLELLLAAGANINAKAKNGETALVKAIKRNHLEVAKVLLVKGTADVIALLLDAGAQVKK